MEKMTFEPIAYIKTDFKEKFGIPRQSGRVASLKGEIVFLPKYRSPESLRGIEGFSHLWILFDFSLSHREEWSPTVRPPRLGGNERVGVFASRSPFRPNPIGMSVVRLEGIAHSDKNGDTLIVSGVDMLDGTPILDIKPYVPNDLIPDAVCGYAEKTRYHRLNVICDDEIMEIVPEEKRRALIGCIEEDPRPAYRDDERVYGMSFAGFEVKFRISGDSAIIEDVKKTD